MPAMKKNIANQLDRARVAVHNALAEADVQGYLLRYSYDRARLEQGQALYLQALDQEQRQHMQRGSLRAANGACVAARAQAGAIYMRHCKLARIALKDDPLAARRLGLYGTRKRALAGWLAQARLFYAATRADPALQAQLATVGLAAAQLDEGLRAVEALEAAEVARARAASEARLATQQRDAALAALGRWYGDLIAVARIALEPEPQLLEKLGVVVPS